MFNREIARGVATLDRYDPSWRDRVDLRRLDTESATNCVAGQVAGGVPFDGTSWRETLYRLGARRHAPSWWLNRWAARRGFDVPSGHLFYHIQRHRALTAEWRDYLAAHRN